MPVPDRRNRAERNWVLAQRQIVCIRKHLRESCRHSISQVGGIREENTDARWHPVCGGGVCIIRDDDTRAKDVDIQRMIYHVHVVRICQGALGPIYAAGKLKTRSRRWLKGVLLR